MDKNNTPWLPAAWPAPENIHAGTTTRKGGYSKSVFSSFNLAEHVGDDAGTVRKNRDFLRQYLDLPEEPFWLQQVHGNIIVNLPHGRKNPEADGSYSRDPGQVCAVLTADCLPLLLCNRAGTEIAAVHVGWRGLCADIVSRALETFTCRNNQLLAWLGPAISATHYETGDEVRDACLRLIHGAEPAFTPARQGHWLMDLNQLVTLQLNQHGIDKIYGKNHCTFSEKENFYSYRRDGITGRCASLIWMDCLKS